MTDSEHAFAMREKAVRPHLTADENERRKIFGTSINGGIGIKGQAVQGAKGGNGGGEHVIRPLA